MIENLNKRKNPRVCGCSNACINAGPVTSVMFLESAEYKLKRLGSSGTAGELILVLLSWNDFRLGKRYTKR